MHRIIVIGSTHHNTLGVIRSIGIADYKVDLILIGNRKSYVAKSKYIRSAIFVQNVNDILDVLLTNYRNESEKSIIITCNDKAESLIDINYNVLSDTFLFFNSVP